MEQQLIKAFIVGMPRAGTTYISKLLNKHSQVVSTGESLYWGRQFVPPENGNTYTEEQRAFILKRLIHNRWSPSFPEEKKEEYIRILTHEFQSIPNDSASPEKPFLALAKAFCTIINKKYFIEKTPHHIQWIQRIQKYFPDAKFIVMLRDPYDFMLSYKFQGLQKNDEARSIFERIYHPIGTSLVWRRNYRTIKAAQNKYPENTFVINTEQLFDSSQITKLQEFLELPVEDLSIKQKDNSSFEKTTAKPKLCEIDYFWMNKIAGKEILELKGQLRKSKTNLLRIIQSLVILPIKFYNLYSALPVAKGQSKITYLAKYLKK